MTCIAYPFC
ncbi:hypothetical protein VN97_g2299, partial [Penicillium thymicola]